MKNLISTGVIALAMFISSCGGGLQEAEVSPLTTDIKGGIGDYIEAVDGSYKVVKAQGFGDDWELTFKLKNKRKGDLNPDNYDLDFKLVLTDEQGKPLNGLKEFWMTDGLWGTASELEKLRSLITEDPGSEEWFTLPMEVEYGSEFNEYLPEGVSKFTIRTDVKEVDNSAMGDAGYDDEDNYASSSGSHEDWDEVLEDYEEYVDKYIKFYKKAMEGDMDAVSEYPALMEKSISLSEKLESARGDMTAKQIGKMTKIQTKMLQAAAGN